MTVVLLLAAAAVVGCVVLAALGRGGAMTDFPADFPAFDAGAMCAADVALLRPPMSLWGYNAQVTDEALRLIAESVSRRDVEIATLRRELARLRAAAGGSGTGENRAGSGESAPAGE